MFNDLIEHQINGNDKACLCGSRAELVEIAAGGTGWVYVHNAADGRELYGFDPARGRPTSSEVERLAAGRS